MQAPVININMQNSEAGGDVSILASLGPAGGVLRLSGKPINVPHAIVSVFSVLQRERGRDGGREVAGKRDDHRGADSDDRGAEDS